MNEYLTALRDRLAGGRDDFPLSTYDILESPRAWIAGGGEFLRHIAWLWCCALLDAPFPTLLAVVYGGDAALSPWIVERLAAGAAIVIIDDAGDRVPRLVEQYPGCRFLLAAKSGNPPEWLLQFSFTCHSLS